VHVTTLQSNVGRIAGSKLLAICCWNNLFRRIFNMHKWESVN